MKKQLELLIARLERANAQLKKMLDSFANDMNEEELNEVLDEIIKNNQLIEKLTKGL
jgi:hypothetical protein